VLKARGKGWRMSTGFRVPPDVTMIAPPSAAQMPGRPAESAPAERRQGPFSCLPIVATMER
jgi:hypothetical protein